MKILQKNQTSLMRLNGKNERVIFDAARDNKGKGIKAADLMEILKKI